MDTEKAKQAAEMIDALEKLKHDYRTYQVGIEQTKRGNKIWTTEVYDGGHLGFITVHNSQLVDMLTLNKQLIEDQIKIVEQRLLDL